MPQVNLGPPYTGFRAFFYPSGSGAWSVSRPNPNTGGVVLQMGVNAPPEHPEGIACAAGFSRDIAASRDGYHSFSVTVQAGPVSVQPRGAYTIEMRIGLTLTGLEVRGETRHWEFPTGNGYVGAQFGTQTLSVAAELVRGRSYKLDFRSSIYMDYSGVPNPAPYAEIIATYRSAVMVTPRIGLPESVEGAEDDRVDRVLARGRIVEREFTDEEMASAGAIELR